MTPTVQDMILQELRESREEIKELRDCMGSLKIDVAKLKVRAGIWGVIAGAVPGLLTAVGVALWVILKSL